MDMDRYHRQPFSGTCSSMRIVWLVSCPGCAAQMYRSRTCMPRCQRPHLPCPLPRPASQMPHPHAPVCCYAPPRQTCHTTPCATQRPVRTHALMLNGWLESSAEIQPRYDSSTRTHARKPRGDCCIPSVHASCQTTPTRRGATTRAATTSPLSRE